MRSMDLNLRPTEATKLNEEMSQHRTIFGVDPGDRSANLARAPDLRAFDCG